MFGVTTLGEGGGVCGSDDVGGSEWAMKLWEEVRALMCGAESMTPAERVWLMTLPEC